MVNLLEIEECRDCAGKGYTAELLIDRRLIAHREDLADEDLPWRKYPCQACGGKGELTGLPLTLARVRGGWPPAKPVRFV